jgi:hypothetical protein
VGATLRLVSVAAAELDLLVVFCGVVVVFGVVLIDRASSYRLHSAPFSHDTCLSTIVPDRRQESTSRTCAG